MTLIRTLFLTMPLLLLAAACSTTKENTLAYFKDLPAAPQGVVSATTAADFKVRLQPEDEITVSVTSAVPEATAMYNAPLANPAWRGSVNTQGQITMQTYVVDPEGNILMPVLGRVAVGGLTVDEAAEKVRTLVARDVKDPFVHVQLVNFVVNVMGEVRNPRRVSVASQRYTVLDALAAAGDLTEYARRDAVIVIREQNGQTTYNRLDLSKTDVFNSPYFYLRQNDAIYVEPNNIRIDNSRFNQNNAYKLSVVSTVVSAASVIASLVIALTVR